MSEWTYVSPQVGLSVSLPGAITSSTSLQLKAPVERNSAAPISHLEEEKSASGCLRSPLSCLHRLDSLPEEGRNLAGAAGVPREDSVASLAFGNGLPIQSVSLSDDITTQVFNTPVSRCVYDDSSTVSANSNNRFSPNTLGSNNNEQISSVSSRLKLSLENLGALDSANNPDSLSANRCQSPSAVSSLGSSAFQGPCETPAFIDKLPSEPAILADKYIILGPVDAATSYALGICNHLPVHVKCVSVRTAREVCSQQALLSSSEVARAPLEAVISGCGKRAWLVFPPHYGDLHSFVRLRRRVREAEAQRLFGQIVTTVAACHQSGLVLRDLKLRKFVFSDANRDQVVLESVEDSVVAGEGDLLHDKHGCPAYVAPEILSSSVYSGRHADMWSLGVILYTMLVGRYPFHNADTSTLFARIRSGKFFIPDWVSSRARHLILSLLRRHPQRRLSADQVLDHPWLNRTPRDHPSRESHDQVVPGEPLSPGLSQPSRKPRLS